MVTFFNCSDKDQGHFKCPWSLSLVHEWTLATISPLLNFEFNSTTDIPQSEPFICPLNFRHLTWNPTSFFGQDYLIFSDDDLRARLSYLPQDLIEALKDQRAVLLIDDKSEGDGSFLYHRIFGFLNSVVTLLEIPAKSVMFLTANFKLANNYTEYSLALGLPELVTIIAEDFFLADTAAKFKTLPPPSENKISKTFLSFNRHFNHYRQHMVLDYFVLGLLDNNLVSLNYPNEDEKKMLLEPFWYEHHGWADTTFTPEFYVSKANQLLEKLPLVVDLKDFSINQTEVLDASVYRSTLLSVINETHSENSALFITEKTYKTIAMEHPFIMLGDKGSITYLKTLGFKTYSDFIDESYDEYDLVVDRKNSILRELIRLDKMSNAEKQSLSEQMAPIAKFNREHLFTLTNSFGSNLMEAVQTYFNKDN